jgi:cell division protein FtsW (lipid II flippase)
MNSLTNIKLKGDRVIWAVVVILSVISLLVVYSSTGTLAYKFQSGNTEYYLFKHGFILLFGLGLMYMTHNIKYTYFSGISLIAIFLAIPLLLLTLMKGSNLNDFQEHLLPFKHRILQSLHSSCTYRVCFRKNKKKLKV